MNKFKRMLISRSPEILSGMAISGFAFSVFSAAKATPKALELLEEKRTEINSAKIPGWEILKIAGPSYIPSAVMFALSTFCVVEANAVHRRRGAALAAAYSISEAAFSEYREKVVEEIGKNKEKRIQEEVSKDKLKNNPVENKTVIVTGGGTSLFYDPISNQYFESSINKIDKAVNLLNKQLLYDYFASLDDFYYAISPNLDLHVHGRDLGWNSDQGFVEVTYDTGITSDDRPCFILKYKVAPREDYSRFG